MRSIRACAKAKAPAMPRACGIAGVSSRQSCTHPPAEAGALDCVSLLRDGVGPMRHLIALACCTLLAACSATSSGEQPAMAPPAPAAAGTPAFDASLLGSIWVAEDIGGAGVIDNLQSKLQFVSASQVAGHGGC